MPTGAAAQAKAAAGAFEAARAATMHPAAGFGQPHPIRALVISNLFGQNAPAIAATEAHYEQMWAQDVAAMAGYHADASAAAAAVGAGPAGIEPWGHQARRIFWVSSRSSRPCRAIRA